MSSQLYPLSPFAFALGMKSCVRVFAPATHPEGGVPAHVPDPAGVPELHDGQSKHDAADDAAALLPNFPAGHLPAQATPYVPPGQETQGGLAVTLRVKPGPQTHAAGVVDPTGLVAPAAPHGAQTALAAPEEVVSFHDSEGQSE